MIIVKPIQRLSWQSFFLAIICMFGCASAEEAQQKLETELLIPQNIVENLLTTYSEKEKTLISNDLKNITQICFQGNTPITDTERVYIATAGGPGACKSTILETYLQEKSNFAYVDPDARTLKFMTNTYYQSLTYHQISKAASYQGLLQNAYKTWRNASNYIAYTILNRAWDEGHNIAHGTTSTSPLIKALFEKLQKKNYKIVLLLCSAPDDIRIKILEHRATSQAFIQSDPEDALNKGKMFCERFPTYFKYADEIHFYWTQDLVTWSTHAATYTKENGLVIHHKDAMNSFTQKYDADRAGQLPSLDELTHKTLVL